MLRFPSHWSTGCILGIVFALLQAWPSAAGAQLPVELRGRRVTDVEIEGQTAGITSPREVGIPIGAPVTRKLLRSATKRLIDTGRWANVQLDVVPSGDGVRILAHLEPRLLLQRIDIQGNELLDDAEIRQIMQVRAGEELRPERLPELVRATKKAYAEQGYEHAEVETIIRDTDDPSRKVLLVRVDEGRPTRIGAVRFVGASPPPEFDLRSELDLDKGDIVDRAAVTKAIRQAEEKLRKKGWLRARLGPPEFVSQDQRVTIRIPAEPGPHFSVRFVGIAPLERGEVREVLKLGEQRLAGPASMEAMAGRVRKLYQRHGFHDAEVSIRTVDVKRTNQTLLLVKVQPGERLKVVRIVFPGAGFFESGFLQDQVVSYLEEDLGEDTILQPVDPYTVDQLGFGGDTRHGRQAPAPLEVDPATVYYEPTYEDAVEHLSELYQADGFLEASVGPAELERLSDGRALVRIPVTEGPRTMLHSVELRGNEALTSREILQASELERGMPFSHLALEEARVRITNLYKEAGYLYARVSPNVRYSGDRTRAKVVLRVVERFPVRVGKVIVRGASHTQESLVRDLCALEQGKLYRPSLARQTQEALSELGIFSGVTVSPRDAELPERVKPVVINLNERPTQYWEWRLGISTGEGARGGFEYGYRNLLGYAVALRLRVQLAHRFFFLQDRLQQTYGELSLENRLERILSASISIPHIPGLPKITTALDVSHQRENERDFGLEQEVKAGVTFNYRPIKPLSLSLSESYEVNNVDLFVDVESIEQLILETEERRLQRLLRVPEGRSKLVATRLSASWDKRDSPFTPTKGYYISTTAEWARTVRTEDVDLPGRSQGFFSNHIKVRATTRGYVPLGQDVVMVGELRMGRVFHLEDNSETYPDRRFYMGGVNTMRGYLQDAMIPQDLAEQIRSTPELGPGQVLRGGDVFALIRGELRFPIHPPLYGGVFTDVGNLWAQAGQLNPLELRPAVGLGLRVATPAGPIALDYGFNVLRRKKLNEDIGAFHFSIGLF
jgi:outer membrane protein assembly factor BamA